jgi:hypothetical protein
MHRPSTLAVAAALLLVPATAAADGPRLSHDAIRTVLTSVGILIPAPSPVPAPQTRTKTEPKQKQPAEPSLGTEIDRALRVLIPAPQPSPAPQTQPSPAPQPATPFVINPTVDDIANVLGQFGRMNSLKVPPPNR